MGNILDRLCIEECQHLNQYIKKIFTEDEKSIKVDLKPLVAKACANIFNRYFCSAKRCDFDNGDFDDYCRYIQDARTKNKEMIKIVNTPIECSITRPFN